MEQLFFYVLIITALINLAQVFFYGFEETNRPNILFGTVLLFFAFAFQKPVLWIKWGIILVTTIGFIATLTGFSDSLKPNWLNYFMMILYLISSTFSIVYFFVL